MYFEREAVGVRRFRGYKGADPVGRWEGCRTGEPEARGVQFAGAWVKLVYGSCGAFAVGVETGGRKQGALGGGDEWLEDSQRNRVNTP